MCIIIFTKVCPICAANLGKDATGHFTTQHAHVVKVYVAPDNIILNVVDMLNFC